VRRPEYLDRVDFLLEGYLSAADAHERIRDLAGARERKRLIGELRQLKSEMLLFAGAERTGRWTPTLRWPELQVIRRNARAYALYREADAFATEMTSAKKRRGQRQRRARSQGRIPRSSYDPLQRLEKRDLVHRIRTLEHEL
jgi:hypothetical protein